MKKVKKKCKIKYFLISILVCLVVLMMTFVHFGGIGTGKSANAEEFEKYADIVENLAIPNDKKIIALGEASHGNKEFQRLKLDVFKILVERYGVRSFLIEGDYGGCEEVNKFIHGSEETAEQAAVKIGFNIYKTDEIAELLEYMREYNSKAKEGDDIRFYGFDMQRVFYTAEIVKQECKKMNIDIYDFEKLILNDKFNNSFDSDYQKEILNNLKNDLEKINAENKIIHSVDMLMQYSEIMSTDVTNAAELRDKFMAENVQWIFEIEKADGRERIFLTAHNSHIAKWGSYNSMGKILSENSKNGYYAIGTDFYKTYCNVPIKGSGKRVNRVFYSHNPLAKAAKICGYDICWIDFNKIPENSELGLQISDYTYMGNIGEGYSFIMRLLPPSYRMFQPPAQLYDSMIFVSSATPIKIKFK